MEGMLGGPSGSRAYCSVSHRTADVSRYRDLTTSVQVKAMSYASIQFQERTSSSNACCSVNHRTVISSSQLESQCCPIMAKLFCAARWLYLPYVLHHELLHCEQVLQT